MACAITAVAWAPCRERTARRPGDRTIPSWARTVLLGTTVGRCDACHRRARNARRAWRRRVDRRDRTLVWWADRRCRCRAGTGPGVRPPRPRTCIVRARRPIGHRSRRPVQPGARSVHPSARGHVRRTWQPFWCARRPVPAAPGMWTAARRDRCGQRTHPHLGCPGADGSGGARGAHPYACLAQRRPERA